MRLEYQKHVIASHLIDTLVELMEQLAEGGKYKGAFFIASQSQKLDAHKFFAYKGFGAIFVWLKNLKLKKMMLPTWRSI